ncbi:polyferredoxin MvhB [Methanocaldococcus villosus KIN24-T80]|uniref:Polyferredoxin MvhB n=1 Tax=Methanocaldococcus villosus KIN24-T80 TaxID=1069083 RepID=N6V0H4_9EURY|nr:polyferredoxin MvhB [Methanocaldococcus villosus KIN24-T80]
MNIIFNKREIIVREDKCLKCLECLIVCPTGAIEEGKYIVEINKNKCVFCGRCEKTCKFNAISIIKLRFENFKITEVKKYEDIYINYNRCVGCLVCLKNCPFNAITTKNDKIDIIKDKCNLCGKCEEVCPSEAIKLR